MPEVRTINGRTLEKHLVRCGVTRAFVPTWLEFRERAIHSRQGQPPEIVREVVWQAGGSLHEAFGQIRDAADYRFAEFDPREPTRQGTQKRGVRKSLGTATYMPHADGRLTLSSVVLHTRPDCPTSTKASGRPYNASACSDVNLSTSPPTPVLAQSDAF